MSFSLSIHRKPNLLFRLQMQRPEPCHVFTKGSKGKDRSRNASWEDNHKFLVSSWKRSFEDNKMTPRREHGRRSGEYGQAPGWGQFLMVLRREALLDMARSNLGWVLMVILIAFVVSFTRFHSCKKYRNTPTFHFVFSLATSLIFMDTGLYLFIGDFIVRQREQYNGLHMVAYFLAKNVHGLVRVVVIPVLFLYVLHFNLYVSLETAWRDEWFSEAWMSYHLEIGYLLLLVTCICQSTAITISILDPASASAINLGVAIAFHVF